MSDLKGFAQWFSDQFFEVAVQDGESGELFISSWTIEELVEDYQRSRLL